jgi:hypothetical protein
VATRSWRPESASWVIGPSGTLGAMGAGPRDSGTKVQASRTGAIQAHGGPSTAFRRRGETCRAFAVATSATHSVMASSVVTVNAMRAPSAAHATLPIAAPAGSAAAMRRGAPPAMDSSERPV